jgi:quaternary ammonium compound-resistance protein SugE
MKVGWLYLIAAGICEMAWPIGFKFTDGFSKNSGAVYGTIAIMFCSFWLMARAIREGIPMGTAYAVWTGIGAVGTAIVGILLFKEPRDLMRILCLGLIIVGLIGLKLHSPAATAPSAKTASIEET